MCVSWFLHLYHLSSASGNIAMHMHCWFPPSPDSRTDKNIFLSILLLEEFKILVFYITKKGWCREEQKLIRPCDKPNLQLPNLIPAIFFSKESSQAYILISLMLLRISFIVRTRLSVINMAFHLNPLMSLAMKSWNTKNKFN